MIFEIFPTSDSEIEFLRGTLQSRDVENHELERCAVHKPTVGSQRVYILF